MENQLHEHVLLERQGGPVDVQTWLWKEELGYGGLHVLLYFAALFGKLLGFYLQVQSLYSKKCFGKWRKSERADSSAEYFMMREFELSLTSPNRDEGFSYYSNFIYILLVFLLQAPQTANLSML